MHRSLFTAVRMAVHMIANRRVALALPALSAALAIALAGCGSDENNTTQFLPLDPNTRRFEVVSNASGSTVTYYTTEGATIPTTSLGQTVKSDLAIYGLTRYDVIDSTGQNFVAGAPISGRYVVQVTPSGNSLVFTIVDSFNNNANVATIVTSRNGTTREAAYAQLNGIPSTAARWAAADSIATVTSVAGS